MLPSEIVDLIETILKQRGISKTEFYSACNVSAAVFSNWRINKNYPSINTLFAINAYLGTNFGITQIEKTAPKDEGGFTDAEKGFMRLFRQLPAEKQDFVIQILQGQVLLETVRDVPAVTK